MPDIVENLKDQVEALEKVIEFFEEFSEAEEEPKLLTDLKDARDTLKRMLPDF
jgi:hypothetical protein